MVDVPKTADIVIVGGGVHGASLAFHFARKKAGRIVLIEKKFIASGPTGRSTALVRRFYAMDFFTRTASAAAEMFRHWKDVVGGDGDPGFQQVGMLVLAGPDTAPYLRHNALRARELGAGVALWADRLLRPLGIEVSITPTRHQMCFFRRPGGFGAHPAVADMVQVTYMRPEHGDLTIHGVLSYDEVVDADHYNEGVDPDEIVRNAELIARRFPVMEHGLAMGGYSGLYDATPDHHPVLGPIPEYAGLYADFGWSGHGFKHSPFIGDILSDVVLHGKAKDYDLTPFRWSRFREGDLVPPARWTAPPHPKHRL